MDATIRAMVMTAYDETVDDAISQGRDGLTAHKEGIVAAAMCLSAMAGIEDAAARAEVEALGLGRS